MVKAGECFLLFLKYFNTLLSVNTLSTHMYSNKTNSDIHENYKSHIEDIMHTKKKPRALVNMRVSHTFVTTNLIL